MELLALPFISLGLSIIICWALFAIFCSLFNEALSIIMADRGRFMKRWMLKQLSDKVNGVNWALMLYQHGSIELLSRAANKPTSNIEPRLFAQTLIEVAGSAHIVQMHKSKQLKLEHSGTTDPTAFYKSTVLNDFKLATLVLNHSDMTGVFKSAMLTAEIGNSSNPNHTETQVYEKLVEEITKWYSEMEGRLSLWYQRKTRKRLFILGTLLAIVVNVNSFQLLSFFKHNPDAQKALISYYEKSETMLEVMAKKEGSNIEELKTDIGFMQEKLDSLAMANDIPVGWKYSILNFEHTPEKQRTESNYSLTGILGFLLSGFAASFGAPFWFDLLKRIRIPQTSKQ